MQEVESDPLCCNNDDRMSKLTSPQQLVHLQQLTGTFVDPTPSNAIETPFDVLHELPAGSQIAVKRGTLYHHGIYLGHNEVMHFSGNSETDARVRKDRVHVFMTPNLSFYHVQYADDTEERRAHTVVVAEFLHAHLHDTEGLYHAALANCECFATYCRTGKGRFVLPIVYRDDDTLHVSRPHLKDTLLFSILTDLSKPSAS